jgi:hypothetical protein
MQWFLRFWYHLKIVEGEYADFQDVEDAYNCFMVRWAHCILEMAQLCNRTERRLAFGCLPASSLALSLILAYLLPHL